MRVKNILIISIAMLILVSSLSVVSAGLFDFLSGSSGLTNEDFGDFSMDIPNDVEFNKSNSLNGGRVLEQAVADNGGQISFTDLYENSHYIHDLWDDENFTWSIELFDIKEDGYNDVDDVVSENFLNESVIEENEDFKIYNLTDSDEPSFVAVKSNDGKSVVTVNGPDKDILTDMISSLKFK